MAGKWCIGTVGICVSMWEKGEGKESARGLKYLHHYTTSASRA